MRRSLVAGAAVLLLAAAGALALLRLRSPSGPAPGPRTAGPSSAPSAAGPAHVPSGEIAVAYPEEPASLNPYLFEGRSNATRDLLRPVLPTLLGVDPGMRYTPALAVQVPAGRDIAQNPFTVTYRLDHGARWSDGTPITSADVRFTWELILDAGAPVADRSRYRRLTDVVAVDPQTVRLVFDGPYPAWPDLFSAGDFVLPKHALEGRDFGQEWETDVPISGGPFLLESRTRGLELVYAANPQWWRTPPRLARVRVFVVPDVETALQLLEAARVQAVVSTTQLNLEARIERVAGATAASRFGSAWWELAFNIQRPAPADQAWRKAVAAGFDRAGIVEALIRSEGRGLQHLYPGRPLDPAFDVHGHDPQAARESMRTAGFREDSDGFFAKSGVPKAALNAPQGNDLAELVQRSIQVGLRNTGIEVDVANPEADRFYGEWGRDGRFDAALWERRGTPSMSLRPHYHSTLHPPGGVNWTRLSSEAADRALDAADRTPTQEAALLNAVMTELAQALPAIPLLEAKMFIGFLGLQGPEPNATVDGPFWNLGEWRLGG